MEWTEAAYAEYKDTIYTATEVWNIKLYGNFRAWCDGICGNDGRRLSQGGLSCDKAIFARRIVICNSAKAMAEYKSCDCLRW